MSYNFVPGILLAPKSRNTLNRKEMTWGRSIDPKTGHRIVCSLMVVQEIHIGLEILMILLKVSWVLRMWIDLKDLLVFSSSLLECDTEQFRSIFKHIYCVLWQCVWFDVLHPWKVKGERLCISKVRALNSYLCYWKVL